MSRIHNLFISHSWAYNNTYLNLITMLESRSHFFHKDFSVPQNDPIHTNGTDKELYDALYHKIYRSGVVIILAGVYSSYSRWIDKEIKIAKKEFANPKPILAVEPWGSIKTSKIVKDNADLIVRWNTESIISAIRQLD